MDSSQNSSENGNSGQDNSAGQEELIIKKLAKDIAETNRKIDDAYDEKIKRLDAKRKLLPDEKEEEMQQARISGLREKLKELKDRISNARKLGKDPLIADLVLGNAAAKIKMAEVTNEQHDFEEVSKILKRAESELEEALNQEEPDVKKEVLEKLRTEYAKETGKVMEE